MPAPAPHVRESVMHLKPNIYLGTKSAYPPPPNAKHTTVIEPPGTSLIHVSLICRHGTRYPTERSVTRFRKLQKFLLNSNPDLHWLPTWAAILDEFEANAGDLTKGGVAEMRSLGVRFQRRYAYLLGDKPIDVSSSSKKRAIESTNAFLDGFNTSHSASSQNALLAAPHVLGGYDDTTLRYHLHDYEYLDFSMSHKESIRESLLTGEDAEATAISQRMANALGVKMMQPEMAHIISEAAAFDIAHGRRTSSPFLPLFEHKDFQYFEAFDRSYRPSLQNKPAFRAISAPLIRALTANLCSAVEGYGAPGDLKFAHSQTLVPFIVLLGIDGNGLVGGEHVPGVVGMSPFAANLTIELFRRDNVALQGDFSDFLVRFRLQERYVSCIAALGEDGRDGIVPLDKLLDFFEDVLSDKADSGCQTN